MASRSVSLTTGSNYGKAISYSASRSQDARNGRGTSLSIHRTRRAASYQHKSWRSSTMEDRSRWLWQVLPSAKQFAKSSETVATSRSTDGEKGVRVMITTPTDCDCTMCHPLDVLCDCDMCRTVRADIDMDRLRDIDTDQNENSQCDLAISWFC